MQSVNATPSDYLSCDNAGIACRYPRLFTLHCTAHALDLALEKISDLPHFSFRIADAKKVIKVLTNHQLVNALFLRFSDLHLLKPGDTRFYSSYISSRRLLRCKSAVQKTVVSDEWAAWKAKSDRKTKDKASFVKKTVMKPEFWQALACYCVLLKPIVRLVRLVDSNMPSMGKVS